MTVKISFVKEELEGGVGAGCKVLAPLPPEINCFYRQSDQEFLPDWVPCNASFRVVRCPDSGVVKISFIGIETVAPKWCEGLCDFHFHALALSPLAPVRESATGVTSAL